MHSTWNYGLTRKSALNGIISRPITAARNSVRRLGLADQPNKPAAAPVKPAATPVKPAATPVKPIKQRSLKELEEQNMRRICMETALLIVKGRQAKKLNQKELASHVFERVQLIEDYESGQVPMSPFVLGKIEREIGIKLRGKDRGSMLPLHRKKAPISKPTSARSLTRSVPRSATRSVPRSSTRSLTRSLPSSAVSTSSDSRMSAKTVKDDKSPKVVTPTKPTKPTKIAKIVKAVKIVKPVKPAKPVRPVKQAKADRLFGLRKKRIVPENATMLQKLNLTTSEERIAKAAAKAEKAAAEAKEVAAKVETSSELSSELSPNSSPQSSSKSSPKSEKSVTATADKTMKTAQRSGGVMSRTFSIIKRK